MYFDFCINEHPQALGPYPIDTIFYIRGDASYQTPRKEITPGKVYYVCTLNGQGKICYDGHRFTVEKGQCLFMQPGAKFSYGCLGDCWEFWWFEWTGSCQPFTPDTPYLIHSNDFFTELFSHSLSYAREGRWDIARLLFEAACEIQNHELAAQASPHALQWQAAQHFIYDNLRTVTVTNLCRILQIQERTLRNIFYEMSGKSPKQVILREKLTAGRQLLESTGLPISEISSLLGFSSQFHFSRMFKAAYGKSPQQYRGGWSCF